MLRQKVCNLFYIDDMVVKVEENVDIRRKKKGMLKLLDQNIPGRINQSKIPVIKVKIYVLGSRIK